MKVVLDLINLSYAQRWMLNVRQGRAEDFRSQDY